MISKKYIDTHTTSCYSLPCLFTLSSATFAASLEVPGSNPPPLFASSEIPAYPFPFSQEASYRVRVPAPFRAFDASSFGRSNMETFHSPIQFHHLAVFLSPLESAPNLPNFGVT
jgi:hypothetical protein